MQKINNKNSIKESDIMLVHDFGIVGEKKDVHLHDDLILYMMDTFEWIKTFSELESNIEKNGLNHGIKKKKFGIKQLIMSTLMIYVYLLILLNKV